MHVNWTEIPAVYLGLCVTSWMRCSELHLCMYRVCTGVYTVCVCVRVRVRVCVEKGW